MFTSGERSGENYARSSLTVMVDLLCSSSKVNSPKNDSAGLTLGEGRLWRISIQTTVSLSTPHMDTHPYCCHGSQGCITVVV